MSAWVASGTFSRTKSSEHDDLCTAEPVASKINNTSTLPFWFPAQIPVSANSFAVNKRLLTGFFIHQYAGYFVLFTGNKASVRYRIGQQ